jgi:dihydrolipoamide dehydrogenase
MVVGDFAQGTQVAVIGAGPGGYVAAIRAAQLGLEVTLVEQHHVGGICLNYGCIPSKALIHAGNLKEQIEHAGDIGIMTTGLSIDIGKLMAWKTKVVERLRKGVATVLSQNKIEVVTGTAYLTGERSFTVETEHGVRRFEFQSCILATGSSPAQLPGMPHDGELIIDSTDALALKEIPERMVVVGAGSVGLELGMVYAKLGSKVTMLAPHDKILRGLDSQIVPVIRKSLDRHGIELVFSARPTSVRRSNGTAELLVSTPEGEKIFPVDRVLVAIGRRPNTSDLGLDKVGVQLDERGFVQVDARMQTSVHGMYAIGDIVAGPMLAHRASFQGKVAAEVIAGEPSAYEGVEVPGVIFTDPEIATVGLSEDDAKKKGIQVKTGTFPFKALGRAATLGDAEGFSKIVTDAESGIVLGVHIVGPHASDLIAEGCLAVASASHLDDLTLTMHPHPTLPESIEAAAEQVEHRAIDIFNPRPKKS